MRDPRSILELLHPSGAAERIRLVGADKSVNRTLEATARALARWKGYTTNLATCPDGTPVTVEFVIDAYRRLFQIEASFRMSKHDLAARPIYRHKRESIEAHLSIVFAALAVGLACFVFAWFQTGPATTRTAAR